MDKRISTALIALRDTLVATIVSLPLAAPLVVVILLRAPEPDPGVNEASQLLDAVGWILPAMLITGNLGFLIAGWWFRRTRPVEGWEAEGGPRPPLFAVIPIGIGVGLGALALAGILIGVTFRLLGVEPPGDELTNALAGASGLAMAAVVVLLTVVAPVGEELFFRGHLFRWSASRCGSAYAYVMSATIFALGHFNPYGIPFYFAVGLILSWSYDRWRTLAVPIVAHATINALIITSLIARAAR